MRARQRRHLGRRQGLELVVAPHLPPQARATTAVVQAKHVARNGRPGRAVFNQFALHVGDHGRLDLIRCDGVGRTAQETRVPPAHHPWVVVSLTAQHHAINVPQVLGDLLVGRHAAVQHDGQVRKVALELVDQFVAQRRDFAVLFGAQALEPRVAGVHDEHAATGVGHGADKVAHEGVALFLVDADAVLHGHRHVDRIDHRLDAIGHELRLGHQAGAKRAALHALARAAAVQVDLVITPARANLRATRQIGRLAAAQLQGEWMLDLVITQVPPLAAVQQAAGGHHLGVQARLFRDQPVQVAAVLVTPIEHRRNGQAPGGHGAHATPSACQFRH